MTLVVHSGISREMFIIYSTFQRLYEPDMDVKMNPHLYLYYII